MQLYKITGEPAQFRAGAIVSLDDKQFAARAHNVEPGEKDGRRTVAIAKNTALGTVIGVGEILNQATTGQSFSGNATPLMMGALAYVILFIPVVVLGRYLETRFAWRRA